MNLVYYASIYLISGAVFMLVLDLLHRMVIHHLDDEFKTGYKNWERIYIILTWPVFIYTVVKDIISSRKQNKN